MRGIFTIAATVGLMLSSSAFAIGGTGGDCKKVAYQAMAEYGITDAIYITKDQFGNGSNKDNWFYFTLPSCARTGYVMVTSDANCYVKEVFTRYGCHVPGVNHYNY